MKQSRRQTPSSIAGRRRRRVVQDRGRRSWQRQNRREWCRFRSALTNEGGLLATAGHVYLKAANSIVDNRSGLLGIRRVDRKTRKWVFSPVELVAHDFPHDVALIKVTAKDSGWKERWESFGGISPVTLEVKDGDRDEGVVVSMRGYFGSDEFPVFLRGSVAGDASIGPLGAHELLIAMPALPGHSGSPLMSADDRVIGLITAIVPVSLSFSSQPTHSGLVRAVDIEHVQRLVEALGK